MSTHYLVSATGSYYRYGDLQVLLNLILPNVYDETLISLNCTMLRKQHVIMNIIQGTSNKMCIDSCDKSTLEYVKSI